MIQILLEIKCYQIQIIDLIYKIYNSYPNPFNPITTIRYNLPEDAFVNITIYNMKGNVVKNMVNNMESAGYKSVQWNATNNAGSLVGAGIYLYMIQAGEFKKTSKMILLKQIYPFHNIKLWSPVFI